MKCRSLLTAVSVLTTMGFASLQLSAQQEISAPPAIVLRGLAMVQLNDPNDFLIGLPDAAGHKATITFVMRSGQSVVFPFRGHGGITVLEPHSSAAVVKVSELVRMKELYGEGIKPLLNRSSNTISIPWSAISRVSVQDITDARYTFVRKDNGQEIKSFRPRQLAETLRIELISVGSVNFDGVKRAFDSNVKEIRIEHLPNGLATDAAFVGHFHHYLHYVLRPAGKEFDVEPKKFFGSTNRTPRKGNSFWIDAYVLCYPVRLD